MKFVYILESLDSEHFYAGMTDDVPARLAKHNAGEVPHTSKTVAHQDLHCIFGREAGNRLREVSQIRIRPRIREEAAVRKLPLTSP